MKTFLIKFANFWLNRSIQWKEYCPRYSASTSLISSPPPAVGSPLCFAPFALNLHIYLSLRCLPTLFNLFFFSLQKFAKMCRRSVSQKHFKKYSSENTVWKNTVWKITVWKNTVWKNIVWKNIVWKNIVWKIHSPHHSGQMSERSQVSRIAP